MSEELLFDVADGVATITLNRPASRSTFSDGMLAGRAEALREAQASDAVEAAMVTGAGMAKFRQKRAPAFKGRWDSRR